MSTITKERLEQLANFRGAPVTRQEEQELARIALASLEAEAVGEVIEQQSGMMLDGLVISEKPTYRNIKGIHNMKMMPLGTKFYTAPPAPVVPAPTSNSSSAFEDFWSNFEHPFAEDDELKSFASEIYRAAMLQSFGNSEQLNSPVIPDGWKLVPIDPTKDMLRAGQSVVGFWLNTVHCYSKMLAAAPAAPQQE